MEKLEKKEPDFGKFKRTFLVETGSYSSSWKVLMVVEKKWGEKRINYLWFFNMSLCH